MIFLRSFTKVSFASYLQNECVITFFCEITTKKNVKYSFKYQFYFDYTLITWKIEGLSVQLWNNEVVASRCEFSACRKILNFVVALLYEKILDIQHPRCPHFCPIYSTLLPNTTWRLSNAFLDSHAFLLWNFNIKFLNIAGSIKDLECERYIKVHVISLEN